MSLGKWVASYELSMRVGVPGIMLRIGLIAPLFVLLGQSQASIILKSMGNYCS